jgi:acyl carrier protein
MSRPWVVDALRFVMELHRQLGVEVPESDYEKLASLTGVVDYVVARRGMPAG